MIVEAVILTADALKSEIYGVNVKLAALPLFDGHERPIPVSRVLDVFRDDEAGRGQVGAELPAIVVAPTPFEEEGEVTTSKKDSSGLGLRIAIGYVTVKSALETAAGHREIAYTLRAIQRCCQTWLGNEYITDRVRHGIQLRDCLAMHVRPEPAEFGDTGLIVGGSLFLDLHVRDTTPGG